MPGITSRESMKAIAALIEVGAMKILRLDARRRNPAATIGRISMLPPVAQAAIACPSHAIAGPCRG